jgi:uncharacterized RDD family membrane protein YckC
MQAQESTTSLRYASFNQRAVALFLDGLILTTLGQLSFWPLLGSQSLLIAGQVVWTLFVAWYSIYGVARWGGTPGKLATKLRIVRLDGSPATLREAALRDAVRCVLSLVTLVESVDMIYAMPPLAGLGFLEAGKLMQEVQQARSVAFGWTLSQWLALLWSAAELLTLLFHPQRRAVHDLIAGTVVIDVGPPRERPATAGLGRRVPARALDFVLFAGVIWTVGTILRGVANEVVVVSYLAIGFAYWVFTPARWGGTLAKLVFGLRIEGPDGVRLSLACALVRASPELALLLAFSIGTKLPLAAPHARDVLLAATMISTQLWLVANALTLLFSGRRSLADVLAGTLVKER